MNAFTRPVVSVLLMITLPAVAMIASAAPTACTATSGAAVPTLVELYTSEGCDSCPPADRWISGLKAEAATGKVVPLSFHVDYWDYIGWKDRFAEPQYGARHREAANRGGAKVVYTPQVFLDGREYQFWRKGPGDFGKASPARPARASLQVTATATAAGVQVSLKGTTSGKRADVFVALFENGISTDVKAGENKGVVLRHDFVVRRWLGPFAFDGGKLGVTQDIVLPADAMAAQSGIAVVATDERGGVLQALAMSLRDCGG